MTIEVDRGGTRLDFVLGPAWTQHLPGVRFQMGRLAAVRARRAGRQRRRPRERAGPGRGPGRGARVRRPDHRRRGGRPGRQVVRYVEEKGPDQPGVEQIPFDPLRTGVRPGEVVRGPGGGRESGGQGDGPAARGRRAMNGRRVTFGLQWDPALVASGEAPVNMSSPTAISGLGLAYYVDTTVDAVAPTAGGPLHEGGRGNGRAAAKGETPRAPSARTSGAGKPYQGRGPAPNLQLSPTNTLDLRVTRPARRPS